MADSRPMLAGQVAVPKQYAPLPPGSASVAKAAAMVYRPVPRAPWAEAKLRAMQSGGALDPGVVPASADQEIVCREMIGDSYSAYASRVAQGGSVERGQSVEWISWKRDCKELLTARLPQAATSWLTTFSGYASRSLTMVLLSKEKQIEVAGWSQTLPLRRSWNLP